MFLRKKKLVMNPLKHTDVILYICSVPNVG